MLFYNLDSILCITVIVLTTESGTTEILSMFSFTKLDNVLHIELLS